VWLGTLYRDEQKTLEDYVRNSRRLREVMGDHVVALLKTGVSVVLDPFRASSLVLVTGDPAVAAHVQGRLRDQAPATLAATRDRAALVVADAAEPAPAFSATAALASISSA
jgi:hypothetical protein